MQILMAGQLKRSNLTRRERKALIIAQSLITKAVRNSSSNLKKEGLMTDEVREFISDISIQLDSMMINPKEYINYDWFTNAG